MPTNLKDMVAYHISLDLTARIYAELVVQAAMTARMGDGIPHAALAAANEIAAEVDTMNTRAQAEFNTLIRKYLTIELESAVKENS